jgi:pimeloyl-ACP methyl ester carboxylesterase
MSAMPSLRSQNRLLGLPRLWREGRTGLELAALLRDPIFRRADPRTGRGRPVLLVPGFLAPDESLGLLGRWLRRSGFHPGGAGMRFNAGCFTAALNALEERAEALRGANKGRVAIIGQSHGGTLGRSLAARRPDLVSGVVAMGSPLVDPFAIHPVARLHVRVVSALGSLGAPGLFSRDCLEGECCSEVRRAAERPFPRSVGFVSVYSRTDAIVDWHACLDPAAEHVEVQASHIGMAVNAEAYAAIGAALERFDAGASRRRRRPSAVA